MAFRIIVVDDISCLRSRLPDDRHIDHGRHDGVVIGHGDGEDALRLLVVDGLASCFILIFLITETRSLIAGSLRDLYHHVFARHLVDCHNVAQTHRHHGLSHVDTNDLLLLCFLQTSDLRVISQLHPSPFIYWGKLYVAVTIAMLRLSDVIFYPCLVTLISNRFGTEAAYNRFFGIGG